MVDRIMAMPEGTRLYLLAPIVRGRKGEYRKELHDLQKRGFTRVKIDGKLHEIDAAPTLNKKLKHDIDVAVDRIVVREGLGNRLADSLETALSLSDGLVFAENADSGERTTFSAKFACPVSGFTIDEIEPRLFSFNNPYGACPACDDRLGTKMFFDPSSSWRTTGSACARARSSPGRIPARNITGQTLDSLAPTAESPPRRLGASCPSACATPFCTARAANPSPCATTTGCAPTRPPSPSRA